LYIKTDICKSGLETVFWFVDSSKTNHLPKRKLQNRGLKYYAKVFVSIYFGFYDNVLFGYK